MTRCFYLLVFALAACARPDPGPSEPLYTIELGERVPAQTEFAGCWRAEMTAGVQARLLQICIDLQADPHQVVLSTPLENSAQIILTQGGLSGRDIHAGTALGAVRFQGQLQDDDTIIGEYYQGTLIETLVFSRFEDEDKA